MALGGVGYWADNYWHTQYWHEDYWAEGGAAPAPATATKDQSNSHSSRTAALMARRFFFAFLSWWILRF